MYRALASLALFALVIGSSGCISRVTPFGNLMDLQKVDMSQDFKTGEECALYVLGFGPFGNASAISAAREAAIKQVAMAEYEVQEYIVFSRRCTVVYGTEETHPGTSRDPAISQIAGPEPGGEDPRAPSARRGLGPSRVGDQIVDAAVLRPLGALSLVGGAISFVVTSPLVLVSQVIDYGTSWDVMVMAPWEYTVERPLGDL